VPVPEVNVAANTAIAVPPLIIVEMGVKAVLVGVLLLLLLVVARVVVLPMNAAVNGDIAVLLPIIVVMDVEVVLVMALLLLLRSILHLLRMVADQLLPRGIVPSMVH